MRIEPIGRRCYVVLVVVAGFFSGFLPDVAKAQPGQSVSPVGYPSFLEARQVAILSSEVDGQVQQVLVEPQDFVKQGDLLIQIDARLVDLALDAIGVNLALNTLAGQEAAVRYDYARDNLAIVRSLYDNPVGGIPVSSQKELKESQQTEKLSQLAKDKVFLERDNLLLEQRKSQIILEKHALRAPFDGVVVPFSSVAAKYLQEREPKRVEAGEVVRAGQMVMVVMRVDKLRVSHWLDVSRLAQVYLGQEVTVMVEEDSQPAAARVVFISPTVNPTGQFNIQVEFDNPPVETSGNPPPGQYRYRYRDGMRARVELVAAEATAKP